MLAITTILSLDPLRHSHSVWKTSGTLCCLPQECWSARSGLTGSNPTTTTIQKDSLPVSRRSARLITSLITWCGTITNSLIGWLLLDHGTLCTFFSWSFLLSHFSSLFLLLMWKKVKGKISLWACTC